jgi:hypothetical protein
VIEQMKIRLPLFADGMGAISLFRAELERTVKIPGTHSKLAPLIERCFEELLFGHKVDLYDRRVISRLADSDVRRICESDFSCSHFSHTGRNDWRKQLRSRFGHGNLVAKHESHIISLAIRWYERNSPIGEESSARLGRERFGKEVQV